MKTHLKKYGTTALIVGGSEGIGKAFAEYLAASGLHLILIARNKEKLENAANELTDKYKINIDYYSYDLAKPESIQSIVKLIETADIHIFVYNAAISHIGAFKAKSSEFYNSMTTANINAPLQLTHKVLEQMEVRQKGAIILLSSLAGFQGSGNVSAYAATKAFNLNLAEGLWYEYKDSGIDILACCPGATSSPNYLRTKPNKMGFFSPKILSPTEVVTEAFQNLGKKPSIITGFGNRMVSILMHRLLPRKQSVKIMGDATTKLYDL